MTHGRIEMLRQRVKSNGGSVEFVGALMLTAVACTSSDTRAPGSATTSSSTSITSGAGGTSTATSEAATTAASGGGGDITGLLEEDFLATELVGRPTPTTAAINVVPATEVSLAIDFGTAKGSYSSSTTPVIALAEEPIVLTLEGLAEDSAIFYRMRWNKPGSSTEALGPERAFHTPRKKGSTFRFTVQADSHLDVNTTVDQYHRTLGNVLADAPDFHVDLGDTFMTEKHSEPFTDVLMAASNEPTVVKRYLFEREHFGLIAHSVPLFLVNGNHDAELGYLYVGGGNDLATWATRARKSFYLNPTPDAFYAGDAIDDPYVGERAAWYSFAWGDALFVALDPFWNTKVKPGKNAWDMTLGKAQYDWLVTTLSTSSAAYKFVFLHNLVGGLDGQQRGGVEAAPYFEWGGLNEDGTSGFAANRPGWAKPIHDLLVASKVTAVFHGHDHVYVHQEKDGIVYQAVPQPSAKNTKNGAQLATDYHYTSGTAMSSAGHVRVTVTPTGVTSEYVRSWLPSAESGTQKNAQVSHTWTKP